MDHRWPLRFDNSALIKTSPGGTLEGKEGTVVEGWRVVKLGGLKKDWYLECGGAGGGLVMDKWWIDVRLLVSQ